MNKVMGKKISTGEITPNQTSRERNVKKEKEKKEEEEPFKSINKMSERSVGIKASRLEYNSENLINKPYN